MSFGAIGGAVASTVVGDMLGGGGGGGGQTQQVQRVADPFNAQSGLFNADFGDGQLNLGLDPRLQGISNLGLGNAQQFMGLAGNNATADLAGQLGQGFLGQLNNTSPFDVAQQQFGLLNPLLQQQQQQDFLNMENRLFSQGRLGSGGALGGNSQLQSLFDSQQDAERKLLFDSLGQGMQFQNQMFNLGTGLSQFNPQLRGLFSNLGAQSLNAPLSIQQGAGNLATVAGGLSGANMTSTTGANAPGIGEQVGAGLINSGVQGLTNSVSGLFSPQAPAVDNSFSGWNI